MSTPPQRKPATPPSAPAAETHDLLAILARHHVITAEQVDRVRRSTKVNGLATEQALLQLGFASESSIAQALAQLAAGHAFLDEPGGRYAPGFQIDLAEGPLRLRIGLPLGDDARDQSSGPAAQELGQ